MNARRTNAPRLLAGLQAGILGGLLTIAWFLVLSLLYFRSPWGLLNLISASLRDNATWGLGLSKATFTGVAAHLFAAGIMGMFVGWVLPRPFSYTRISITGFAFGVILSLLVFEFFWKRYVPLMGEYMPEYGSLMVHLLFGVSLATFPRFYNALAPAAGPAPMRAIPVAFPQNGPASEGN